ncbi:MAG: hypothetical protein DRJ05_15095 [Bacteroidetes bacterium]|nr:MAG: hypothetical protein DRJ05_15095 [Bacteroidota bacterium]
MTKVAGKNRDDLQIKLDGIISKSTAQKKILEKILSQLNKQNEDLEIQKKNTSNDDIVREQSK